MKAAFYTKYGNSNVIHIREVEKPAPQENEVLIRIYAASINSWDWDRLTGEPRLYRILHGLFKPKLNILGADIAGEVVSVGKYVVEFKPGDRVFADLSAHHWGGFAEYVSVPEDILSTIPAEMSYEQAASIPQAGLLAFQGLTSKRHIEAKQKVLINGAGGGVGTIAIQIAKLYNAEITCVDRTEKLEALLSLGADYAIDYTIDDFTKNGKQYDFILDINAHHSMFDYKRALAPGGIYVILGGTVRRIFQALFVGTWFNITGNKKFSILAHKPNEGLDDLLVIFNEGKLKPIIDRTFPLEKTADAFRYFGEGRFKGKIIITMQV
jgi:NADPH:quinone reductase-like Zn-dependent oxidoreductase